MKVKYVSALTLSALLAFSPFAFSETEAAKQDGEVIAWVSAIDNFEVKASELADTKKLDTAVKDYASMLKSDHSKNLKEVTALSEEIKQKPVDTKALDSFKESGKADLAKLDKHTSDFQKDFIDAMVTGHTEALNKVDTDLMKKVSDEKLKTLLQATRDMIAHHLEVAKEIQKNMTTNS